MTCTTTDMSKINTHIHGIINDYFGLEPHEIMNLIESRRMQSERQRKYQKTYEQKIKQDPDAYAKILETKRNWYERNKEKVRQYQNERIRTDDDAYQQMLSKKREWYAKNRDKILAKQKQNYHEKNDAIPKKPPGRKPKGSASSNSQSTSENEE